MISHTLRDMTADDREIVEHLFVATRAEEFASLALPAEQKAQLLAMQAAAQLTDYRMRYPDASWYVIDVEGIPVGRLLVERSARQILLIDLALLPHVQGQGIGSAVIESFQAEARLEAIALRLSVVRSNTRAKALYERLGFIGEDATSTEVHLGMLWSGTPADRASRSAS